MKALAFILLPVLMELIHAAATVTPVFTGTEFIYQYDAFYDSAAFLKNGTMVFKSGSLESKLENITEFRCSTEKKICLVGADFVYLTIGANTDGSNFTRQMMYSVRPQTTFRIHSRVAFIPGTDYFLSVSLSKYGINRWKIGKNDSFTQLKVQGVGNSLEASDLLVVDRSKYALVTFATSTSIYLIDFLAMTETRTISGRAGMMALLSADPSLAHFVCASENQITKYSYLDGTAIATFRNDYIVTGMQNVNNTDFVIVATWEQVFVYSFAGSDTAAWVASPYFYATTGKQMPGGIRFDQSTGTMYFSGLGHVTSLTDTASAYCHSSCTGCSIMLSESKCSSCKAPAALDNGACKISAENLKAPPGGKIDYATAAWSEDNMKPAPGKGFNIKDYYLYFIIGGGGLASICIIFCICKMCCCKKNDENQQQQSNNPNRVSHEQQYPQKSAY
jgi:hypothetical protein